MRREELRTQGVGSRVLTTQTEGGTERPLMFNSVRARPPRSRPCLYFVFANIAAFSDEFWLMVVVVMGIVMMVIMVIKMIMLIMVISITLRVAAAEVVVMITIIIITIRRILRIMIFSTTITTTTININNDKK